MGRRGRNPQPVANPAPARNRGRGAAPAPAAAGAAPAPQVANYGIEEDSDPEIEENILMEPNPNVAVDPVVGAVGADPPPVGANPLPAVDPQVGAGPLPPPPNFAGMVERQTLVMERMAAILEQGQGQQRYEW